MPGNIGKLGKIPGNFRPDKFADNSGNSPPSRHRRITKLVRIALAAAAMDAPFDEVMPWGDFDEAAAIEHGGEP